MGRAVDAEVRQLTRAGRKKVFREVVSGATTDRNRLRRSLGQLVVGEVIAALSLRLPETQSRRHQEQPRNNADRLDRADSQRPV